MYLLQRNPVTSATLVKSFSHVELEPCCLCLDDTFLLLHSCCSFFGQMPPVKCVLLENRVNTFDMFVKFEDDPEFRERGS